MGLFDSAICSSSSNVIVWLVGVNGFSEESVSGTFGPPAGGTGGGILPSKTSWYDVKVNFSLDSACVVSAKLLTSEVEVNNFAETTHAESIEKFTLTASHEVFAF